MGNEDKIVSKSATGRFPMLESKDQTRVCGGLSIARSLARGHPTFYGADND